MLQDRHRKGFQGKQDGESGIDRNDNISMTHGEQVELQSFESWSRRSASIPSVHRESLELENSWAGSTEMSFATGRQTHGRGREIYRSAQFSNTWPSRTGKEELGTRRHHERPVPKERHTGSRGNATSFGEVRNFRPVDGEPEVIEPVIYEHEVWNLDRGAPEVYHYIVPGGLNVIFRDEYGNESMRVGEFGDSIHKPRRVFPTIIQDELGNELYRTGDFGPVTGMTFAFDGSDDDGTTHASSRERHHSHNSRKYSGHHEGRRRRSPSHDIARSVEPLMMSERLRICSLLGAYRQGDIQL
ncbi:hypothetical protein D9615_000339 [Tricholomella constricta]|uniref:Uncharacterized protein n=1 Tax=Tricholomella constricta TaxID=117010 RepID=A0A8H5HR13_9AGAR|nr:hypothetical protein D9615_000339 [Tricholomella constricta]